MNLILLYWRTTDETHIVAGNQIVLAVYERSTSSIQTKKGVDMKHLVDLEFIASSIKSDNASGGVILDVLYEHACELSLTALIDAIELYWQNRADQLTIEEYNEAQEQSIKEQFSDD